MVNGRIIIESLNKYINNLNVVLIINEITSDFL